MSTGFIRGGSDNIAEADLVNASTGAAFVGTVTVYVTIDDGAQVLGTVNAGIATAKGNGLYQYYPSAAESDGTVCTYTFTGTGAVPRSPQYWTISPSQASTLQTATGSVSTPVSTLLADAMKEIRVLGAGQTPSNEDASDVLGKLNRLLDNWNADRKAVYVEQFHTYTFTPNLQPHTIGPNSATFSVISRPVSIEGANLVIGSGTSAYRIPINATRTLSWWSRVSLQGQGSGFPTDLYYQPNWPNGSLYFWPVPTSAYGIELLTRLVLAQVVAADVFWMPPGYRDAITLTLAEAITPMFGEAAVLSPQTIKDAALARGRVFGNNVAVPSLRTQDAGMPSGQRTGMGYNYLSGSWDR